MRSVVELLNRSPAEHDLHYGPKSSTERTMSGQGFTAVNGLDRRQSGMSAEAINESTTDPATMSNPPAQPEESCRGDSQPFRQTATRNDSVLYQDPAIKLSPDTAKRKRSMMNNPEDLRRDSPPSVVALSPKRRMTESRNNFHSNNPDGSSLNLLNTHVSIEPGTRERCSRERSPVPTRNQRMAPPQVRPETEAHLAESLATHLKDAKTKAPTNGAHIAQKALVPTQYEEPPIDTYSPLDIGDPNNKRKRNFSNRTKTGCHTCRTRKKKCDEGKPECGNCLRGGFDCTGYGPKPMEGHKGVNAKNRAQVPLQSKVQDVPQRSPAPLSSDGPRYDHWGRIPPPTPNATDPEYRVPPATGPHDPKYAHGRDVWRNSSWYRETEGSAPYNHVFSSVEHSQSMPPTGHPDQWPHRAAWRNPGHPPQYPGPVASIGSRESMRIHSSRNPPFAPLLSSEVSEKHKMLIGEPYKGHIDAELLDDRQSCRAAVERWNQSHQYARATSDEEKGRLFKAILDPYQRPDSNHQYNDTSTPLTRPGSLGVRVVIISPFTCDYGYNIHIGDDTYIGANCSMEDAGEISIGARVHIGKDVLFCATNEPINRLGSQADLTAGAITIEDEVIIGPRTTILPHRTIGKGATIAAGSVVTRNIPPHTFAGGNPCRVIRHLPPAGDQLQSPEHKRHSRELTVNTTNSSIGSGFSEEDGFADKQILAENERSLRAMRARKGIRE